MPSQTLSLSQSQRLQMTMAPQLRQSLEILQIPVLELRQMIRKEIEQNPTLEETPLDTPTVEIEPGGAAENVEEPAQEMDFEKEYEALAKLDDEWRDYFFQDMQGDGSSADQRKSRQFFFDSLSRSETLQEHLVRQLSFAELSEEDEPVARLVIGSINDDGYLTTPPEELAASVDCDRQHFMDILAVIQSFHPTGVGARDVRECLLIQLERLGKETSLAADIVRDHLDRLAARKFAQIARALKVPDEDIRKAQTLISTLEPKPGRIYTSEEPAYVLAEIVVGKVDGAYTIVLNDDPLPRLRISRKYRRLMENPDTPAEVRAYIRERIRASSFLIKSIDQRQRTIHRIAAEIVRVQSAFLDNGIESLKPMTMAEVARTVGVHETTVSRAVAGKYMQTPAGLFELKYFFTTGFKMGNGDEVSNASVKDRIAHMVAGEDSTRPLSDQDLVDQLREQGVEVARRTIAKYRLALRIPPSHLRKTL